MSLRGRLQRVAALETCDRRALADGVRAAMRLEFLLRTQPLSRAIAWAESRPARTARENLDGHRLQVLSAWPYRAIGVSPSCLRRSLVLTALLRQRGQPAVICVGVRKHGAGLRAHAWVQCAAATYDTGTEPFERLHSPVEAQLTRNVRWFP
jgi:hypothetical protein